jgi:VCBS repeat-containing protein
MAGPTAEEQLYVELINETRLNPLAAAARYISSFSPLASSDPDIQLALNFFGVDGTALQTALAALAPVGPVAWNEQLGAAASGHNAAIISADEQSHQLPGELDLGGRATAAGYAGWSNLGENVYAYAESALYGHAGFVVDWGFGPGGMQSPAGHRDNIVNAKFREIGVNVTLESNPDTEVGPEVVTQDFGARSGKYFVLGVAYTDSDADHFYSIGEGRGDLTIQVGTSSATSWASGGYSLGVSAGTVGITMTGGGLASAITVSTTITTENIKLDVVDGNTLLSSGSITVTSGTVAIVRGLGAHGLSLAAGAGNQTVEGNSGNDTLTGGSGNDTIIGNAGVDTAVYSGKRADYLITQEAQAYRLVDQRAGTNDGNDLTINIEEYQFADGLVLAADLLTTTNAAPVANGDKASALEDSAVKITVLANDTDADQDTLAVTSVGDPPNGVAVVNDDGTITYTAEANFNGSDSFVYSIADGKGGTASGTVTVTVTAVNDAPAIGSSSQAVTTAEDIAVTGIVAASDIDGDALTYSVSTAAGHGTATINPTTGTFTYTPAADYNGSDSFVVTATDASALSVEQTVNVTITPVNDVPRAGSQTTTTLNLAENTSAPVVLDFTDPENNTPLVLNMVQGPAHGTFGAVDGKLAYTPFPNFNGSDTIVYSVSDSLGATSMPHTVAITVTPVNGAPVSFSDGPFAIDEDTTLSRTVATGLLANDIDYDGDALVADLVSPVQHGTLAFSADGSFSYTPNADYNGTDSFVYQAKDPSGAASITQTVTFYINPINDSPDAVSDTGLKTPYQTSLLTDITALLANDTDADSDVLTVTSVQNATHGTVDLANGKVTFTPDADFSGAAGYTYTVSDSSGGSDTATVQITVGSADNAAPIFAVPSQTLVAVTGLSSSLVAAASDPDGDQLTFTAGKAAHGVVTGDADGPFAYTPEAGYLGADSFTVTADDGMGGTATQSVAVSVVALPPGDDWRLFAASGFEGSVGGDGSVFGTAGFQDISVLDHAGRIVFDPSFNKGGDVVRLPGDAADWQIVRTGSSALLTDGDTFAQIPLGGAGTALVFDDGARTLKVDAGAPLIGDQPFGLVLETVTAAADGTIVPDGAVSDAQARLFLAGGAGVSIGGNVDVFGSAAEEIVSLDAGDITLDPSFNKGGDTILLESPADGFTAARVGSSVFLDGAQTDVLIPVGAAGATLTFADGHARELVYDAALASIRIGDQLIGTAPVALAEFA